MLGLRSERSRWEESAARLEVALVAVPGDAALASAFLSYAGPFPADLRETLSAAWHTQVRRNHAEIQQGTIEVSAVRRLPSLLS